MLLRGLLRSVIDEPKLYRIVAEGELHDFPPSMIAAKLKVAEQQLF